MYKTSAEFEPKTMLYQWQYVQNQYRIRKYRRSSWRYSYSSLAGDTHTQAKPVLKSIEYLLILILIARIGNHTHDYLSIQVLSCHPTLEILLSAAAAARARRHPCQWQRLAQDGGARRRDWLRRAHQHRNHVAARRPHRSAATPWARVHPAT